MRIFSVSVPASPLVMNLKYPAHEVVVIGVSDTPWILQISRNQLPSNQRKAINPILLPDVSARGESGLPFPVLNMMVPSWVPYESISTSSAPPPFPRILIALEGLFFPIPRYFAMPTCPLEYAMPHDTSLQCAPFAPVIQDICVERFDILISWSIKFSFIECHIETESGVHGVTVASSVYAPYPTVIIQSVQKNATADKTDFFNFGASIFRIYWYLVKI